MRKKSSHIVRDVARVRNFVMDIIYRAEGRSVLIPSTPELAKRFGFARTTVREAVEKLAAESFLIPRRGIGTFTNPLKSFDLDGERMLPLVGLKFYTGDHFYYDNVQLRKLGLLMTALSKVECNVRLLHASCSTADEFADELHNAHLDAVVTVSVLPELVRRAADILPVFAIGEPPPGVDGLVLAMVDDTKDLEELLLFRPRADGNGARRRPRLCYLESGTPPGQDGIFGLEKSPGIDFRRIELRGERLDFSEALDLALADGCPEGFLLRGRWTEALIKALEKRGHLPERDYRIVNSDPSQAESGLPAHYYTNDWDEVAAAIPEPLSRLLSGEKVGRAGVFKQRLLPCSRL